MPARFDSKAAVIHPILRKLSVRAIGSDVTRGALFILIGQVASKGVIYFATLFLAQSLSLIDFGTFNFFLISSALLTTYISFGLPLAGTKFAAEVKSEPSAHRQDMMFALFAIMLAVTLVAVISAPLFLPLLSSDEFPLHGAWLVLGAIVASWTSFAQACLFGLGKFKAALLPVLIGSLAVMVGAVAAALTAELWPVLAGSIGGGIIITIWSLVLLRYFELVPALREWRLPTANESRVALSVAVPGVGLSVVSATWNWLIAKSLVENQSSIAEFGIYSVGLQWFALLMLIPTAASVAFYRKYVETANVGSSQLRSVFVPSLTVGGVLLLIAPVAAMSAPALVWLYGGNLSFSPLFVAVVVAAAAVNAAQAVLAYAVIAFRGVIAWLAPCVASLVICVIFLHLAPPKTALLAFIIMLVVNFIQSIAAVLLLSRGTRASATAPTKMLHEEHLS